jgi:small-conductance mechanosensitive channel
MALLAIAFLMAPPAFSQPAAPQDSESELRRWAKTALDTARPADRPATLVYANRPIVEFRASVLFRAPAERATAAGHLLDRLVNEAPRAQVTTVRVGDGTAIKMDDRLVFGILPLDVDLLKGETLEGKTADAAANLRLAFDEALELRNPSRLLVSGSLAFGATVLYMGALWLALRTRRAAADHWSRSAERGLERLPGAEVLIGGHAPEFVRRASVFVAVLLALLLTDMWATFVLRRFPYTRPWGESLRNALLSGLVSFVQMVVDALPGLFTVLLIVLVTRFVVRLVALAFDAVEQGRLSIPGVFPETAQPTRRIVVALLWLFALIVSYQYLPGSGSEAFKGVSVFVGLMVSLGSTGIMNQIMSGLTITYSRALRLGDFVRVGDVEGTVMHLGTLATKIKTPRNEDITIPNAVVVSHETTNYSRHAPDDGVFVPTTLTIGYDAPWRQVQALLLLAARRTAGIRSAPSPVVRQTALQDFYVQYTLLVCLEAPQRRGPVLDALHANIQDAFNEHGVQIMSPNYEADPSAPKIVPRSQWYAAPATPDPLSARPQDAER